MKWFLMTCVIAALAGFGGVAAYSMSSDARTVLFTVIIMGVLTIVIGVMLIYAGRGRPEPQLSGQTVPMLAPPQTNQPPVIVVGGLPQPQAQPSAPAPIFQNWTRAAERHDAGVWGSED